MDRECPGDYKYSKVGIIAYQRVITADNREIFNKKSHQLTLWSGKDKNPTNYFPAPLSLSLSSTKNIKNQENISGLSQSARGPSPNRYRFQWRMTLSPVRSLKIYCKPSWRSTNDKVDASQSQSWDSKELDKCLNAHFRVYFLCKTITSLDSAMTSSGSDSINII